MYTWVASPKYTLEIKTFDTGDPTLSFKVEVSIETEPGCYKPMGGEWGMGNNPGISWARVLEIRDAYNRGEVPD